MPSWDELLHELGTKGGDQAAAEWLNTRQQTLLQRIGDRRGGRNVILYGSAFLQKPQVPAPWLQLTHEELNGFMSVLFGMDWDKGITLVLHTPGGVTNAAETIVSYLRSKFADIEVIVPTFAMSAGTMISLGTDRIVMGRQSQLGPIDPQLPFGSGRFISARAVKDQFELAKADVRQDLTQAHVWAPILQTIGPSLLQEALNALDYGERMVATWLEAGMFKNHSDPRAAANAAAAHFNDASVHKSHGRRIDRDEARSNGIVVEDLEADQDLQDDVLTAYHLMTIMFEKSAATKMLVSSMGRRWIKNFVMPQA